jgi:hypothetical protein
LRELAAESAQMAEEISLLGPSPPRRVESGRSAEPSGLMATAELLVEHYLEAADHATDETTLEHAQSLARKAIVRLARLRNAETEAKGGGQQNEKSGNTEARWPS